MNLGKNYRRKINPEKNDQERKSGQRKMYIVRFKICNKIPKP